MQAGRSVFFAGCLATCIVQLVAACATFGSPSSADDAGVLEGGGGSADGDATASCPAETCDGRTACTLWDFAGGTCAPLDVSSNGASSIGDCASGKMHLAADFTDDLVATARRQPPTNGYSALRVAFRLSAARWDGGRAIQIKLAGTNLATMRIDDDQTGTLIAALCRQNTDVCLSPTVSFPAGTEHLFAFDIDATTTKLFVDCVEIASFPTLGALVTDSDVEIQLGHNDANPFNGTYDDVLVWFKQ